MVAIIAGSGLGLFNTSFNQLNGAGAIGNGQIGRTQGTSFVNVASGNLLLQFNDQTLSGRGADIRQLRTYNSQGNTTDGDNDRWRWLGEKRVRLEGTRNQNGSRVIRTTGDGHSEVYEWRDGAYRGYEGTGADDTIVFRDNQWVWTEGSTRHTETYHNQTGWIKTSRDSTGDGFNYTFTGDRLTQIRDERSGQFTTLTYDGNNRLSQLRTQDGSRSGSVTHVYYHYDSRGRLDRVTTDLNDDNSISDNHTYVTRYTFDGNSNRVASVSQSDGTTVHFTYERASNGEYRVKTTSDRSGTTTFTYHDNRTDVTDGVGNTTQYHYDDRNRLTRVESAPVEGESQVSTYGYDDKNNVIEMTDGNVRTTYTYDSESKLRSETDGNGNTTTYRYHSGLLASRTFTVGMEFNPRIATERMIYNQARELRFTVSAEGRVIEYRYNHGLRTKTLHYSHLPYDISALTPTQTISLGALKNWATRQEPSIMMITEHGYDHRGNLTHEIQYGEIDGSGNGVLNRRASRTDFVYSGYGELLETITRHGNNLEEQATQTTYVYDGLGREIERVSSAGRATTTYNNNTIQTINFATGLSTTQSFDNTGRLTGVIRSSFFNSADVQSRVSNHYYDSAGRLAMTESQSDSGWHRAFTFYDEANRVRYRVDAEGGVVEYSYRSDGKLSQETHYRRTVNTDSWFNGTTVTVTTPTGLRTDSKRDRITSYGYDNGGRQSELHRHGLTSSSGTANLVTRNTYDQADRLIRVTTGNRSTHYFYDKDNRQIGMVDGEGYLTTSTYDNAGRKTAQHRYTRVITDSLIDRRDIADIFSYAAEEGERLSTRYFYDAQGRQVGVLNEQGFLTEVTFDAFNRQRQDHTYMNTVEYHDANFLSDLVSRAGNRQTDTTQFDVHGRVLTVTHHDGSISRNEYNDAGQLVRSEIASGTDFERATRHRYNTFGELTGTVSGEGVEREANLDIAIDRYGMEYAYDRLGRKRYEEGQFGAKKYFYYDDKNRLIYTLQRSNADVRTNSQGQNETPFHVVGYLYNAHDQITSTRQYHQFFYTASADEMTGGDINNVVGEQALIDLRNDDVDTVLTTNYNRLGLVSSRSDAERRLTSVYYNDQGDVARERTFFDINTHFNTTTSYDYDNLGRRIAYSINGNEQSRTTFDGFGRVTTQTDANGNVTRTEYHDNGRRVDTIDALGRRTSVTYDAFGRELTITDANGQTTTMSYDDRARRTTVTTPTGAQVITEKRPDGLVSLKIDAENSRTQYVYNKDGNLVREVDAESNTTRHSYTDDQLLHETTDANGNQVRYVYGAGRQVRQEITDTKGNGDNPITAYEYDGQGRVSRKIDGYGNATTQRITEYHYDRTGRIIAEIVDPDGLAVRTGYAYNGHGHQIRVEKGSVSDPAQQVTTFEYDANGRVTKEIKDPGGLQIETEFKYDDNGNMTRRIDARGYSTWYVFDTANQNTHMIDALGYVTTFNYDDNGQLVTTYRHAGKIETDSLGDVVTSIRTPILNPGDQITHIVRDSDGREQFTLTKTSHDKVWSEAFDFVATENIYDNNGNVIETRRFDQLIDFGIHTNIAVPRTQAEVLSALRSQGYRADNWGDSNTQLGNSRVTRYVYDNVNRLRYTVDAMNHIVKHDYDNVGNLRFKTEYALPGTLSEDNLISVEQSEHDRRTEYRYDGANRLTQELTDELSVTQNGRTYTGRLKTTTHYDALNQVISREEGTIERTGESDVTDHTRTTTFGYDKVGRQIRTILPGWYDINDQRVYKDNSGDDRFQRTIDVTYDDVGNAVKNRIRVGQNTYVEEYKAYDALNRVRFSMDGERHLSETRYDDEGNITHEVRYQFAKGRSAPTDPGYWTEDALWDYVQNHSKRIITHRYDAVGNKTHTFLPSSNTNYVSNASSSYTPPGAIGDRAYTDAGTVEYSHNAFREVVEQREKIDRTQWLRTQFTYDAIGREVRKVVGENGTQVAVNTATYDALGNMTQRVEYDFSRTIKTQAGQGDRVWHYRHDKLGRTIEVIRPGVQVAQSHAQAAARITTKAAPLTAGVSSAAPRLKSASFAPSAPSFKAASFGFKAASSGPYGTPGSGGSSGSSGPYGTPGSGGSSGSSGPYGTPGSGGSSGSGSSGGSSGFRQFGRIKRFRQFERVQWFR